MSRTAGKRGKLPVKPEGERFALKFVHEYLGQPLPAPQYPVDVSGGITEWGMDGNDRYGDCTFAGRLHYEMSKSAANGEPMPTETATQLVAEYLAYDHGQDVGANIADLLLSWYRAGVILGFAPVDHTDRSQCDAAMAQFKGLYLGGDLTDDADQLFENHEPWTVADGQQPDPQDGHCFLRVKSTGADPGAMSTDVTWGAEQESTAAWDAACITEAWVIVMSQDEMNPEELAALQADIAALGGTGGTPANGTHVPTPESLLAKLAAEIRRIAARSEPVSELLHWLKEHGL